MKPYEVILVGGGIIGGALAFELARRGVSVLLLDRQLPCQEASWAAAGMLSPSPDSGDSAPLVPLAKESQRLYPDFVSRVEKASGKPVGLRTCGALEVFFAPQGEREQNHRLAELKRHGIAAQAISVEEANALEPMLNAAARAALWLPEEMVLDPRELCERTFEAAQSAGAEIRPGCEAIRVWTEQNRCQGVLTAGVAPRQVGAGTARGGEKLAGQKVIIAAGAFSVEIGGSEPYAPTEPARGQMVSLRGAAGGLRCVLRSAHGYLVPRADGRIIAGSTLEHAGFEKRVTPSGLRKILDAAMELVPSLENSAVLESWSGLRPDSPDHFPILGATGIRGLFVATGHFRNGILLAPATAKYMTELVLEGRSSFPIDRFSPLRFAAAKRGVSR